MRYYDVRFFEYRQELNRGLTLWMIRGPSFHRKDIIRQVLSDVSGVILFHDLPALNLNGIHRGKDPDFHQNKNRQTSSQTPKRKSVSTILFKRFRFGAFGLKLLRFGLLPEAVAQYGNSLLIRTRQQIESVRLSFHKR